MVRTESHPRIGLGSSASRPPAAPQSPMSEPPALAALKNATLRLAAVVLRKSTPPGGWATACDHCDPGVVCLRRDVGMCRSS